jgi:hypothetical protein
MRVPRIALPISLHLLSALVCGTPAFGDGPALTVDLASVSVNDGVLRRVHGYTGTGTHGVPVAGGFDCNGDTFVDYAMASIQASPMGRSLAGEIYLVFGNGTLSGSVNTAVMQPDILRIIGDVTSEIAGSDIWMDDVTGDGVGDLLIGRQNFTFSGRIGAGALNILVGGPQLKDLAEDLTVLDLRAPPAEIVMTTLVGDAAHHRLGIWMRTGDVTGDGIADIVVGADQTSTPTEAHRGAVWVIRGGPHLAVNQTIDLAAFGATALNGHLARILPPAGSAHYHFGGTCQIADLDGNGKGEVLVSAALNRASASLPASGAPAGQAHGTGGTVDGTLYIAWDDNFTGNPWAPALSFDISSSPGFRSIIDGGARNRYFGEEILGGLDYDGDNEADLFVGDIVGDGTVAQNRPNSGTGHVIYDADQLKGLTFDLDTPPGGVYITTFLGGASGDIAADTAAHGDFDGDGFDDLTFSSPLADPMGRINAGTLHIFHGRSGHWPALIDLLPGALPPSSQIRISEIYGANGTSGTDSGDILCYSAAMGDVNGDGRVDIITNEMQGNGVAPSAEDVGNMILLSGGLVAVGGEVPALSGKGVILLASLLVTAGALTVRRRRPPTEQQFRKRAKHLGIES